MEKELRLLKQKIDLLLDGYQVLYMRIEQQTKSLQRLEHLVTMLAPQRAPEIVDEEDAKVVRMSERFINRVRKNFHEEEANLDDDPQPS